METMERKKPRPPPVFHAGVQGEIVERCRAGDRTAGQVARDFDLTETAGRAWGAGAETERREAAALTSAERDCRDFVGKTVIAVSSGQSRRRNTWSVQGCLPAGVPPVTVAGFS